MNPRTTTSQFHGRRFAAPRMAARYLRRTKAGEISRSAGFLFAAVCLLGMWVLLCGCAAQKAGRGPSIEFTRIPLAGEGGPDKFDTIEGRVAGASPGQKIVLFAKWGPWWVQPLADQPFTAIQPDARWKGRTHFGTEYAAMLVASGYQPPPKLDFLPSHGEGVVAVAVTRGRPVFWLSWWFLTVCGAAVVLIVALFFRARMKRLAHQLDLRLEERLAERTRIAQELHDTLLQDFLSVSMQLNVANDQLPVDSPAKPLLTRALEMMRMVIEESRNTVQGLRSSSWGGKDLERAIAHIPQELAIANSTRFRVIVEGAARPLRPSIGDDVYLIAREALANAFRHSQADEVEVELEYAGNRLRLLVRDNGCGIDTGVLRSSKARHLGLSAMHERSARIGGKLTVLSRAELGTEIELAVPAHKVYCPRESDRPASWFSRLHPVNAEKNDSLAETKKL